jgi:hypothetical protein
MPVGDLSGKITAPLNAVLLRTARLYADASLPMVDLAPGLIGWQRRPRAARDIAPVRVAA